MVTRTSVSSSGCVPRVLKIQSYRLLVIPRFTQIVEQSYYQEDKSKGYVMELQVKMLNQNPQVFHSRNSTIFVFQCPVPLSFSTQYYNV